MSNRFTLGLVALILMTLVGESWGQTAIPARPLTRPSTTNPNEPTKPQDEPIPAPGVVLVTDPNALVVEPPTIPPIVERTRLMAINDLDLARTPTRMLEFWSNGHNVNAPERPPSPLGREMTTVEWQIMTGDWEGLAAYLLGLESEEAVAVYDAILVKLARPPINAQQSGHPAGQAFRETNVMGIDDLWGIILACPSSHSDETLKRLGPLLRLSVSNGNAPDALIDQLLALPEPEMDNQPGSLTKRQCAQLLYGAGLSDRLEPFLPDSAIAIAEDDAEALNLLAAMYRARYSKDRETEDLEMSWKMTQAVLASLTTDDESREEALTQAVSLSALVRDELGQSWLDASFSQDPQRGMDILAAVGANTTRGLMIYPTSPHQRIQGIELLTLSVHALLEQSPERGMDWRETLTILAMVWIKEAELSNRMDRSSSSGPILQYDNFGNPFFMDQNQFLQRQQAQQNQPRPIPIADLLKHRPSDEWVALLDPSVQPSFQEWIARLHLKVQEEDKAFPYIELLCESQPDTATELVHEFLRVWANNHDPNTGRRLQSPIFAIYGFSQRAEGIPLTRSKQERNLAELSAWVGRLEALPIWEEIDERLLVRAFTVSHSSAEVYELESIASVFGDIESLDPLTLAGLVQQMRRNLAGLWREPDTQKQNQTNRRKKDIEAEVLRGYLVANQVVENALLKHPDHWALLLARAALMHDEVNYRQDIATSSSFTEQRLEALAAFRLAADAYAGQIVAMDTSEESIQVYELWFNASLGACDVGELDGEKLPILTEPPVIREAIESLPPDVSDRHMALFANSLFTRLRSVAPGVKFRFLKNGFEIVGDHEQALEAKKVFDYYDDLVTEIELVTRVDGSPNVGDELPFGVFVDIRHTREIERESGGFGRYLQNQNNVQYSYNYGRPTENYRDKFEDSVRLALGEHFEVLSVTFQTEDVSSKADAEYGWRVTPYAYLMVRSRGEEVDRIPPIKLDLDFLDTSGYVVLPIESPMLAVSSRSDEADPRDFEILTVEQTLDERQAKDGKLILEIKATAHGLVPELDDLVDLDAPGFDVKNIDDQGISVSRFDPEADDTVIVSERLWMITMEGAEGLASLPKEFTFASVLLASNDTKYQRYNDADLELVSQTVALESNYGTTSKAMFWIVGSVSLIGLTLVGGLVLILSRRGGTSESKAIRLPDDITPFSVIGVLREIHRHNGLNADQRSQLEDEIHRLEGAYFAPEASEDADLRRVAERWLKRARV